MTLPSIGPSLTTDAETAAGSVRLALRPLGQQLRGVRELIVCSTSPSAARPTTGRWADHETPRFDVPMAEELLARWPDWAIPGIDGLPPDSVTPLETNPEFVAALLVGLNQEFNRELLWREFPTDQRGTAFARFWPTEGADVDEIGRWPVETPLGGLLRDSAGDIAMLVRGELLHRFPGTALLAVQASTASCPRSSPAGRALRWRWTSPPCSTSSRG